MIYSHKDKLKNLNILLVSESKSRRELLTKLNLFPFEITKSGFDEDICKNSTKDYLDYSRQTTQGKVTSFLAKMRKEPVQFDLAIFCDSISRSHSGQIFEKPGSVPKHVQMLKTFSDQEIFACSSVALVYNVQSIRNLVEKTSCDSSMSAFEVGTLGSFGLI